MTEESSGALEAHRETVRRLMRAGGPLSAMGPNATLNHRAWFRGGKPTAERALLHARLLADSLAGRVASGRTPRAMILAGPPGAGKSHARAALLGADADRWLSIDADDFKHELLREAIADGTYETVIKPPEVREREAGGERFAPLELASLVHEESSRLARLLREAAIDEHLDVVIDTVLSSADVGLEVAQRLDSAGYAIRVVDVETTAAISAARVEARWRDVSVNFVDGVDETGLGGRWVPSEFLRDVFPSGPDGPSVCEGNARRVAQECPAVLEYDLFRVASVTGEPVRELSMARAARGAALVDAAAARAVRTAQLGRPSRPLER